MNNEKMKDSLSAMMDNAADELEVRRVLANADDELLATWSRYQLARSAMHKEPIFPKLDIVSAVSAAIESEPNNIEPIAGVDNKQQKKYAGFSDLWSGFGKFATAASILAITLSTVYFFNDDDVSDAASRTYASGNGALNNSGVASVDPQVDKKMVELIERHEKQGLLIKEDKSLIPQSKQ